MNTPNRLTVLRVLLVPIFLLFLMIPTIPHHYGLALVIFIAASITDCLDGHIARKRGQVTTFGKFLDPLADKILVSSALICFIELGLASSIAVVLIIFREFMVTSIRLVASADGKVIAASIWGKLKTVLQMVAIITILLSRDLTASGLLPAAFPDVALARGLIWLCAAVTLISGADYLKANWDSVNTTR